MVRLPDLCCRGLPFLTSRCNKNRSPHPARQAENPRLGVFFLTAKQEGKQLPHSTFRLVRYRGRQALEWELGFLRLKFRFCVFAISGRWFRSLSFGFGEVGFTETGGFTASGCLGPTIDQTIRGVPFARRGRATWNTHAVC